MMGIKKAERRTLKMAAHHGFHVESLILAALGFEYDFSISPCVFSDVFPKTERFLHAMDFDVPLNRSELIDLIVLDSTNPRNDESIKEIIALQISGFLNGGRDEL